MKIQELCEILNINSNKLASLGKQKWGVININRKDFDIIVDIDWVCDDVMLLGDIFDCLNQDGLKISKETFLEKYEKINKNLDAPSLYAVFATIIRNGELK